MKVLFFKETFTGKTTVQAAFKQFYCHNDCENFKYRAEKAIRLCQLQGWGNRGVFILLQISSDTFNFLPNFPFTTSESEHNY